MSVIRSASRPFLPFVLFIFMATLFTISAHAQSVDFTMNWTSQPPASVNAGTRFNYAFNLVNPQTAVAANVTILFDLNATGTTIAFPPSMGPYACVSTNPPCMGCPPARTYDQQSGGTFGQFIEAVTAAQAIGSTDRSIQILQVEQSDRYRTNVGLAEVTGKEVTVEIAAIVPESTVVPTLRLTLQPNEFTQLNGVLQQMNLGTVYNGRLSVSVVDGEGRIAAYGSVIDQQTQDPTYVPAQ